MGKIVESQTVINEDGKEELAYRLTLDGKEIVNGWLEKLGLNNYGISSPTEYQDSASFLVANDYSNFSMQETIVLLAMHKTI